MPKRFTDTNKYKKPFVRGLQGAYKLLWDYLYHDCDHAGIWIVDFEIAQLYIGSDMPVNKADALKYFNADEERIIEICDGKKWLIRSFIEFQYGILDGRNRVHNSILLELDKLNINKGLIRALQGCKDKEKDNSIIVDYDSIVELYHNLCTKLSKVVSLNETRKGFINARVTEFGIEKVTEVLRKAGASDFLNGVNDKAWKADLEWIMRPNNFLKIMEGKYDNKEIPQQKSRYEPVIEIPYPSVSRTKNQNA